MRKILTIFALCCLLFLIGGYHLLYQFRLAEIKSAVKKELLGVGKAGLTQLVMPASDFAALEWEGNSEFSYRNEMYDVVQVEKNGADVICWCLADKKETALIDNYAKTQNSTSDKQSSQSLFKLLQVPFLPVSHVHCPGIFTMAYKHASPYILRLSSLNVLVLTPPPRFC